MTDEQMTKIVNWMDEQLDDESIAEGFVKSKDPKKFITDNLDELRQYPGWSSIESAVYKDPATENLDKLAKQYDKFEDIPETYFYNLAEAAEMTPADAKAYVLKAMKKQSEKINEQQKLADEYKRSKETLHLPGFLENEYSKAARLKGDAR